jgi:hypothetical protein
MVRGTKQEVTVRGRDECPYVPGFDRHDWLLPDSKGQDIAVVARIRDETKERVQRLVRLKGGGVSLLHNRNGGAQGLK